MVRRIAVLAGLLCAGCRTASPSADKPREHDAASARADAEAPCRPAARLLWARAAGDADGSARALSVLVGEDGSVVVAGEFSGTIAFDRGGPNETTLIGPDGRASGGFLARFGADGTLQWAERVTHGSAGDQLAAAVLTDDAIVVAGFFGGAASFGPDGEAPFTVAWGSALFVASFELGGELRWARASGGMTTIDGLVLAASPDGGSLVAGRFAGGTAAVLGPGEEHETTLTGDGAFLARHAADGSLLWATAAARPDVAGSPIALSGVTAASPNGAYLTGWFCGGNLVLGSGETRESTFENGQPCTPQDPFTPTGFVARFDHEGALAWAREQTASMSAPLAAVGTASDGALVVVGNHRGDVTLGAGEPGETTLRGDGPFLARYASDGALARATAIGATTISAATSQADVTLASIVGLADGCSAGQSDGHREVVLLGSDDAIRWSADLGLADVAVLGLDSEGATSAVAGSFVGDLDLGGARLRGEGSLANVFVAVLVP